MVLLKEQRNVGFIFLEEKLERGQLIDNSS